MRAALATPALMCALLMVSACDASSSVPRSGAAGERGGSSEGQPLGDLLEGVAGSDSTYQRVAVPSSPGTTIRVRPAAVRPGGTVALTFADHDALRGVGFSLASVNGDGRRVDYYLTSDAAGARPSWSPPGGTLDWPDVGVSGRGPDQVVLPDTAGGQYLLCTVDATHEQCGMVTVRERVDEEPDAGLERLSVSQIWVSDDEPVPLSPSSW